MERIVVTRHPALVDLLVEKGLVPKGTESRPHVAAEDVRGKHVFGILPTPLRLEADRVTEIPLRTTPEDRAAGELSLDRLREIAGDPLTTRTILVE